jgi:hypothetical protein
VAIRIGPQTTPALLHWSQVDKCTSETNTVAAFIDWCDKEIACSVVIRASLKFFSRPRFSSLEQSVSLGSRGNLAKFHVQQLVILQYSDLIHS